MKTPLELPYGRENIAFDLPPKWEADLFRPNPVPSAKDPRAEVLQALDRPLGNKPLEHFRRAASVAIAIPDETRLIPYPLILPPLLDRLGRMGIAPPDVRILIASGLHPPMTRAWCYFKRIIFFVSTCIPAVRR